MPSLKGGQPAVGARRTGRSVVSQEVALTGHGTSDLGVWFGPVSGTALDTADERSFAGRAGFASQRRRTPCGRGPGRQHRSAVWRGIRD